MQIFGFNFFLFEIHRKILSHFLGKRCCDNTKTFFDCHFCFFYKVLNLTSVNTLFKNRSHNNFWINKPCRTNDLLNNLLAFFLFVFSWRCSRINHLPNTLFKFGIFERTIVCRRRQPKSEINECLFTRLISCVHRTDL